MKDVVYQIHELLTTVHTVSSNTDERLLEIHGKSPVTGRIETLLSITGDKYELVEFVSKLQNKIERS